MSVQIAHWGDEPGHELKGDTPLWRYMKLSTFHLLLDGKAFFPSVETLQKGDPLEGVFSMDHSWWDHVISLLPGAGASLSEWLNNLATDKKPSCRDLPEEFYQSLRRRRAVWCWHEAEDESAAMWSIYANAGIAVRTDVASLRDALPGEHEFLISRIKYLPRNQQPFASFRWDPTEGSGSQLVVRPPLIKGVEYAHEKEVRVSTFCHPKEPGWCVNGINPKNLIKEIVVSPCVPHDEYVALDRHLAVLTEKHGTRPAIRRSALLGDLVGREKQDALFINVFPNHKEVDLPSPIEDL